MDRPVLLTGVTGFIAKRIALDLLNAGYYVRGSLRSMKRSDEVREAVTPHLKDPEHIHRLSFVELELAKDEGWSAALDGAGALMHTASPFPMAQPKNPEDIIRPAVDGTNRALATAQAAGVTRVLMTSSVVAIQAKDLPAGQAYSEDDWSETDHPTASPYFQSKTLAERAAWDVASAHPEMQLTMINPALVLGAPLDANYGTSLQLLERVFNGKDPVVPNVGFGVVDVADVSAMHVAALAKPETAGERFIASSASVTLPDIARYLASTHPSRKIPTRIAPKLLLQVLSLFDPTIKTVLPGLGQLPEFDTSKAQERLGIAFTPWKTAVDRSAEVLAQA